MTDPADRRRSKTQTYEIAISGLLTKRADTLAELLRVRAQAIELEGDLAAMDRVLGTLGYQGDLEAVPARLVRDAPFGRGQVMRAILDHMREAGTPLTARQIAEGALGQHADEEQAEPVPLDSLARRVSKALGRLRRDGAVIGSSDGAGAVLWALTAA